MTSFHAVTMQYASTQQYIIVYSKSATWGHNWNELSGISITTIFFPHVWDVERSPTASEANATIAHNRAHVFQLFRTLTIQNVKFLSKNSILTKNPTVSRVFQPNYFWQFFSWNQSCQQLKSPKPQHFHEFFTPKKIRQFSREIKVEFLDKKWRFRTVWFIACFSSIPALVPCSLLLALCSLLPILCSLLFVPCFLHPVFCALFLHPAFCTLCLHLCMLFRLLLHIFFSQFIHRPQGMSCQHMNMKKHQMKNLIWNRCQTF